MKTTGVSARDREGRILPLRTARRRQTIEVLLSLSWKWVESSNAQGTRFGTATRFEQDGTHSEHVHMLSTSTHTLTPHKDLRDFDCKYVGVQCIGMLAELSGSNPCTRGVCTQQAARGRTHRFTSPSNTRTGRSKGPSSIQQ